MLANTDTKLLSLLVTSIAALGILYGSYTAGLYAHKALATAWADSRTRYSAT